MILILNSASLLSWKIFLSLLKKKSSYPCSEDIIICLIDKSIHLFYAIIGLFHLCPQFWPFIPFFSLLYILQRNLRGCGSLSSLFQSTRCSCGIQVLSCAWQHGPYQGWISRKILLSLYSVNTTVRICPCWFLESWSTNPLYLKSSISISWTGLYQPCISTLQNKTSL